MRDALASLRTTILLEPEPGMDADEALRYLRSRLASLRVQLRAVKLRLANPASADPFSFRLWVDEELICILCGPHEAEHKARRLTRLDSCTRLEVGESGVIRLGWRYQPGENTAGYLNNRFGGDGYRFAAQALDDASSPSRPSRCRVRITRLPTPSPAAQSTCT
jgi:hypothetical protein